ncbi:MAG: HlyD family efflux transporter periplasmic adaptor subunit [Candidatus Marithrix sp.]
MSSYLFFVTELNYAVLQPNKNVSITTDAYQSKIFHGEIARIAPIFNPKTHQAQVELRINNPELRLKPGMFVHITIVLKKVENAIIIPVSAIIIRNEKQGVFLLSKDKKSVLWYKIETGIQQGEHIQLIKPNLIGKLVVLGQHLLNNGSSVTLFKNKTN